MENIILAGGCFWCTEAIFKSLKGVIDAIPGYSGGDIQNPGYYQVASGETNHAECVFVTFNPNIIKLEDILRVFFKLHDPTELNRQGADIGTQYRSAIFYVDEEQRKVAEKIKSEISNDYKNQVVTEITKYKNFFPAEPEHKDYYFKNRSNAYCRIVIDPKIEKLKKEFSQITK